ncbi:MAG: hypothetical protein MUD08_06460 [Cytophagales bacterium]|jgi:hypothetical protein|nr:hypothetical protein [Cytophagales bacterium]
MSRTFGFIVIALLLLGTVGLVFMGGFAKPELSQTRLPVYAIAGKPFRGKSTSDTLLRLFDESKQLHAAGKLPGTLTAVYYDNPGEKPGRVDVWVGVLLRDTTTQLPTGYLLRTFPSTDAVRAEIKAHYMVAPTPDKVKTQLQEFAAERNLKPGNVVIERYLGEQEIIMEIPVTSR